MKQKKEKLIPFSVALISLLVDGDQFDRWQHEGRFELRINDRGEKCIQESDFKKLCYSDDVRQASLSALAHQAILLREDVSSGIAERFVIRKNELIGKYRDFIKALEKLHRKYHARIDVLTDETAVAAAYILYSKIVNLPYLLNQSLENNYYHANILFRPIDEHIDLAEYFIFTDGTSKGQKHLNEWFREDKSPRHEIIRQELAKHSYSISKSGSVKGNKVLRDELYHIKSKMVHPTFKEIIEIYPPDGFDYEGCYFPRKVLEMTEFFLSSIVTAFQGFYFCFLEKMPLDEEDKETITKYLDIFEDQKKNRAVL